jgi:hypothetical protein
MVDEMEGRGQSSKDDTEDAEDEVEDDEIKEGTENDDWNKGVAGGTIMSNPRPRWLGARDDVCVGVNESELTEAWRGER